jgi:HAD superfamily hydrolase (TIGR01484 family)
MMKQFEGLVFDIDNTAVPEGSLEVTSEPLSEAFRMLDKDIPVMAATGRTKEFALPITSQLRLHHESIIANGAQIMDSISGRVLWQNNLSIAQVQRIISLCGDYDSAAHCCIAGDPMGSFLTAHEQSAREAPGVFFMNLSEETAYEFARKLNEEEAVSIYVSSSEGAGKNLFDVNVGNHNTNKGATLLRLLGQKALDPKRIIAVGDSVNDIELFKVVGYRIATADAHPDLLEMADEVVPAQSQDGLLEVVQKFI